MLPGYLNDPLSCADGNVGPFNPMGSENFVVESQNASHGQYCDRMLG